MDRATLGKTATSMQINSGGDLQGYPRGRQAWELHLKNQTFRAGVFALHMVDTGLTQHPIWSP